MVGFWHSQRKPFSVNAFINPLPSHKIIPKQLFKNEHFKKMDVCVASENVFWLNISQISLHKVT